MIEKRNKRWHAWKTYNLTDRYNSWSKADETVAANDLDYIPVNDSKKLTIHLETDEMKLTSLASF